MSDLSGQPLGDYTLRRQIGVGEHGAVYEAASSDGRTLALKVFDERVAGAPGFAQSLAQRAAAFKVIGHEAVAPVEAYGAGDPCYLVTSYLPTSLGTLLRRRKSDERTWPLANALAAMRRAAEGLAQAHGQGVLHLNLKPSNLRFGADDAAPNTLQLVDFSIQPLTAEELQSGRVSPATLSYAIAPELWLDQAPGPWSDVYALGAMLYEIAVGAPPFNAATPAAAYGSHISSRPRPPRNVRPDISRALEQVIEQCLAREPRDRYQSAQQLISALNDVEKEFKTPPPPPLVAAAAPVAPAATQTPFGQPSVEVRNVQGDLQKQEELLGDPLRVGRTASDVPLADATGDIQIWWDGAQVYVESLGGDEPPVLNQLPLTPNQPTPWAQTDIVRLTPYFLRLTTTAPPPRNGNGAHTLPENSNAKAVGQTPSTNRGNYTIQALETTLVLTPGEETSTTLSIRNLSGTGVAHLAIRVVGEQETWVLADPPIKQLNPGESVSVKLQVGVKRKPNPHAGQYATTIQLVSKSNNNEVLDEISLAWHVAAFADPQLKLVPHRWRSWRTGTYTIRLRNNGNTPARGSIADVVDENNEGSPGCLFYQQPADDQKSADPWKPQVQFVLEPDSNDRWPLQVRAPHPYWFGSDSLRHNFQIKATQDAIPEPPSINGSSLRLSPTPTRKIEVADTKTFTQWPIFAPWMLWTLLLLLVLSAIGALLWPNLEAKPLDLVVRGTPALLHVEARNIHNLLLNQHGTTIPITVTSLLVWRNNFTLIPTLERGLPISIEGRNILGITITKEIPYTVLEPSATPMTQVTVITAVTPVTQVVTVAATPSPITPMAPPILPTATGTPTPTATLPPNCQLGSGVQLTNPNGSVAQNASVLIFIQRRGLDGRLVEVAVGGGVSDAQGRVTFPLALREPPGFHTFIVRERYTRRLLGEFHCVLFATPPPTAQPTAPPRTPTK